MTKLTIERAIADGVSPASLRAVAAANDNGKSRRRLDQAEHLRELAKQLELEQHLRDARAAA